ncbi:MAG: Fic family protein [Coxiellaceae bacterium]|nr:Fic family protein [Coxiellaceae bacterium]
MTEWVWKSKKWPKFTWDDKSLSPLLLAARGLQGKLIGVVHVINNEAAEELNLSVLTNEAVDTSAIEGEFLNRDSVRSSIANRLGLKHSGMQSSPNRYIEGLLDMLFNATHAYDQKLTIERLLGWQASLFPTGYSGIHKIMVGKLRQTDDMRIVSGRPGKEIIHYHAPPAKSAASGMQQLLKWFNQPSEIDGLLRAAVTHIWFELLHPFEDGNGRVGRALVDLALSQDEQLDTRYYSMSSAIMQDRKSYYAQLTQACSGDLDITSWLQWFIGCFQQAIQNALDLIEDITMKSQFWQRHAKITLNAKQIKVLNKLLDAGVDGFDGGMTTRKYMGITRVSRATAYRDLSDLVRKGCLKLSGGQGRSVAYEINW